VSVLAYKAIKSKKQRRDHRRAFGGQAVSFAGLLLVLGLSWGGLDGAGVFLAAVSAVLIALVYLFGDHLMQRVSPLVLSLYVALINLFLFTGISAVTNASVVPINRMGWVGLFGAVVLFVAGFMGMFAGVKLLGASRAACLKNFEPVVTVGLAMVLLGESYGILQLLGVGIVLTGVVTGCHSFWRSDPATVASAGGPTLGAVDLADCTPLCRMDSRCLLT
jgi:drug/metabolite transporter (DMT)-like permease